MMALYEFPYGTRERIIQTHLSDRWDSSVVRKLGSGAFGTEYLLTHHAHPKRLVAKAPAIERFGTPDREAEGLEALIYEVEHAHRFHRIPWVNRISEVQIVHGWPFFWSRWRMGTLADLIDDPAGWDLSD